MLLSQGVHPKVVSERLGHASIGITLDTYSHVLPSMQEEAAEKIDAGLRAALAGLWATRLGFGAAAPGHNFLICTSRGGRHDHFWFDT